MDESSNKVVVLTALPLEYAAVRQLLLEPARVDYAGTVFECGRLPGTPWTVCLGVTGAGNVSAAAITERAINFFRPLAVFFTGIAGRLKSDVSPGDVVVAVEVYAYQGGKQDPGQFKVRSRSWEASHRLQQVAMHVHAVGAWKVRLPEVARTSTKVHFKPVVAGEIVVNAPQDSELRLFLDQNYNGAVAVEMEGAGFASAAHKAESVPHLMIRGISDRADGTKGHTDDEGLQEAAARHAALFLAEVIAGLAPLSEAGPLQSAFPKPVRDELTWQELDAPVDVIWRKELEPSTGFGAAPALLELHLVPVPAQGRVPARRMRQLAEGLVELGRAQGLFTVAQQVDVHSTAELAIAAVADPRGGAWSGLAVTRSGQRSAWESLPKPGITYVLDEDHTRDRIAALIALLHAIDCPEAPAYALAVGIDNTMMVTAERLSQVDPQRSSGLRMTDTPVRVAPEEAVGADLAVHHSSELAAELSVRLAYAFRSPNR